MARLYFAQDDEHISLFPCSPDFVDLLVHATFTGSLSCVESITKDQSRRTLDTLLTLGELVALDSLTLSGAPRFSKCGYNGYTAENPYVQPNYSFQFVDFNGFDVFMGEAFVGSSGTVYTPTLPVSFAGNSDSRSQFDKGDFRVGGRSSVGGKDELPSLLLVKEGRLHQAQYNIMSGQFESVERSKPFDLASVKMASRVQGYSTYIRNRNLMEVPFQFKNEGSYPDGFTFIPNSPRNLVKHIGCSIGFAGWNLGSFYDQLFIHFSMRGKVMRSVASGDRFHPFITQESIGGFSFASYDELSLVIPTLAKGPESVNRLDRGSRLSRYLLYRSLVSRVPGSLLVGQIAGDSRTIHVPYVRVEPR